MRNIQGEYVEYYLEDIDNSIIVQELLVPLREVDQNEDSIFLNLQDKYNSPTKRVLRCEYAHVYSEGGF